MPEFILDTGGVVKAASGDRVAFYALPILTQGYIKALFWTEEERLRFPDTGPGLGGRMGDDRIAFDLLAPEALSFIVEDCAAFQQMAAAELAAAESRGYGAERAGHDFWLTRNGHGAGFWDRDELEPAGPEWDATHIPLDQWTPELRATRERLKAESLGQRLTDFAKAFGELDVYLGDDGKVWL